MGRIGIFGGTFNPIHNGHVNLANKVCEVLKLDKLLIIPTKIPPHKIAKNLANSQDRIEMCRLAFEDNEIAEICDYEILHNDKSYTIYTLRHLKSIYPNDEFYLIMGSDMILSFETWKEYKEIFKLAVLVAASRSIEDSKRISEYSKQIEKMGGKCIIVPIEPYEISSTQIREMMAHGEDFTCYLPEKVVRYIGQKNLYK